jgi:hypothetical protein
MSSDELYDLVKQNVTEFVLALEATLFEILSENKLEQNLVTTNVMKIANPMLEQYFNELYHNINIVNNVMTEMLRISKMHKNCFVKFYVEIISNTFLGINRQDLDISAFNKYIDSVNVDVSLQFTLLKDIFMKSVKVCDDKCFEEYDKIKMPFKVMITEEEMSDHGSDSGSESENEIEIFDKLTQEELKTGNVDEMQKQFYAAMLGDTYNTGEYYMDESDSDNSV